MIWLIWVAFSCSSISRTQPKIYIPLAKTRLSVTILTSYNDHPLRNPTHSHISSRAVAATWTLRILVRTLLIARLGGQLRVQRLPHGQHLCTPKRIVRHGVVQNVVATAVFNDTVLEGWILLRLLLFRMCLIRGTRRESQVATSIVHLRPRLSAVWVSTLQYDSRSSSGAFCAWNPRSPTLEVEAKFTHNVIVIRNS